MKAEIEDAIKKSFPDANQVSKAIHYALLSGGKRVRPLIVYYIAEALGHNLDVVDAALAVEFFHTASLIADDLPCMDNDCFRRGKSSLHKVFGESVALLASYALIAEAFKKIEENGQKMAQSKGEFSKKAFEAVSIALKQASVSAGIQGAVLGQYYDLCRFSKNELTDQFFEKVAYLKTGTLFEGAFVLGWVFGGGDFDRLCAVKKMARHFGFAFQIKDDLKDIDQDRQKQGLNYAVFVGEDLARKRAQSEMDAFLSILEGLPINYAKFNSLLAELSQGVLLQQV